MMELCDIEKIDSRKMRGFLEAFPAQLREAYAIGEAFAVDRFGGLRFKSVVFAGVGGSAIGADVVKDILRDQSKVPVVVNRSYTLPAFVDGETLLFVGSYSGNTEEALSAYELGKRRNAKIVVASSGGKLEALALKFNDPRIKLPQGFPPRTAIGYSVIPALIVLSKLGIAPFVKDDFDETLTVLEEQKRKYSPGSSGENEAWQVSLALYRKFPFIYAPSDLFESVSLRWRGQIEENAKALAAHHLLPEMNHNEIAGWSETGNVLENLAAVFLRDAGEHPRVRARMEITERLVERQGAKVVRVWSAGKSLLARIFSLIYLGDFASYYLAIRYGVDPTSISAIDYIKEEIAKA